MKKKWLIGALTATLLLALTWAMGITPSYLYNAPSVATGIGARLACSMHYVMGQNEEQVARDIKVYSPMLAFLHYEFDDTKQSVSASLLGYSRTASYQRHLGCDLNYAGFDTRASLRWPDLAPVAAPWPWGQEVSSLRPDLTAKLVAMLEEDNKLGLDTRALLVAHQGEIVAEAYASGYNEQSLFLGWSMSKSLTGLLVGQLELEGRLLTQERHLFGWQDERQDITLEQLLQMTDGLAFEEVYEPGATAPAMLFQAPDTAAFMQALPLKTTPGEAYRYSSGSTNLVMKLVQERSGANPQEALNRLGERFFTPLGFAPMVFETDSVGLPMGSSYLYTSARNWAKLGQLMLDKGELNGQRFVSEDFVSRATTPNSAANGQDFGYNWWLNTGTDKPRWPSLNPNVYAAKGNREQRIMVLPDQHLVIVRLGWSKGAYRDDENFANISSWF